MTKWTVAEKKGRAEIMKCLNLECDSASRVEGGVEGGIGCRKKPLRLLTV